MNHDHERKIIHGRKERMGTKKRQKEKGGKRKIYCCFPIIYQIYFPKTQNYSLFVVIQILPHIKLAIFLYLFIDSFIK